MSRVRSRILSRVELHPELRILPRSVSLAGWCRSWCVGGDGRFEEAVRLNREHWMETGRPISAETLRKRLRLSSGTSRRWCRMIRDADRAAVCRPG